MVVLCIILIRDQLFFKCRISVKYLSQVHAPLKENSARFIHLSCLCVYGLDHSLYYSSHRASWYTILNYLGMGLMYSQT